MARSLVVGFQLSSKDMQGGDNMGRFFTICVSIAFLFVAGASFTRTSGAASASHLAIAAGAADLAFDLYGEIGSKEENIFFSPYSIASAVGMTYAGARGETATEMRKALHFQLEQAGLNSAFKSLNEKLSRAADGADQTLRVANALVLTGGKCGRATWTFSGNITMQRSSEGIFRQSICG
jgi:serpin B